MALIQGDIDGVALRDRAQSTFDRIQTPPKALISVKGANHFGITDVNHPTGANPDRNTPTLDRAVGIETIARWSALFLRANMLEDSAGLYLLSRRRPRSECQRHQRCSSRTIFSSRSGDVWYSGTWLSLEKMESWQQCY